MDGYLGSPTKSGVIQNDSKAVGPSTGICYGRKAPEQGSEEELKHAPPGLFFGKDVREQLYAGQEEQTAAGSATGC